MRKLFFLLFLFFQGLHGHAQLINLFAGNGVPAYSGDGGLATAASVNRPIFCFKDAAGDLLISDYNNSRIRKVTPAGIISTVCGTGTPGFSGDGGPAIAAEIQNPTGLKIDGAGNIYFCDFNNQCIRKINTAGIISTIAGTPGVSGYSGDGGPATAAKIWFPGDLALDVAGNVYVTDEWNNRIRKINTAGIISTIAGAGALGYLLGGYSGDGGAAVTADINFPVGIFIDPSGDVIFSDDGNNRVRKITPAGIISTIAGTGVAGSTGDDGPATLAELHNPEGVSVDQSGDVFICEAGGNRVREINNIGIITTIVGTGTAGYTGDGGEAVSADIDFPEGLYVDTNTFCIYLCDASNNRVRVIGICSSPDVACNSVTLPDSIKICQGDTTTIHAVLVGTDSVLSYTWTPATGLSSTTILDPLFTATTSGWYHINVQSLNPTELVVNGAFTDGDVGFTSSYTYVYSGTGELEPEDVYAIVTDPYPAHTAACSFHDHTTGTGNMMAINGASTPISVWCETIPVTPNTNYDFSAWVANWSGADVGTGDPLLQFQINGVLIGTADDITSACGTWVNFFATWNSGTATSAAICIYDETTAADGNDFALDDISFKQICSVTDSVYIEVNKPDTTTAHTDTSVCANIGTITLTALSGYYTYLWSTGSTATTITVTGSGDYYVYDSGSACHILVDTFDVTYRHLDTTTTHTDDTVCANATSVNLTGASGYSSYYWITGSTGGTIVVSTAGDYWVDQTDSSTCSVLVDTFDLYFRPLPVITLGNDTAFCQGDTLLVKSIQPAGDTLLWSTGSTGDSIYIDTSGTYTLTVRNGCVATASITVTVSPIPLVNLGPDITECSGAPVVLQSSDTYTGVVTYLWSDATAGITDTVTASGTYWLQVTIAGCSGADTINVSILYDTFTLYNRDTAICKGQSVQVFASGNTAAQTYNWEPTTGIINNTVITPLITPDTSATYAVFVLYPGCPGFVDSFHIDVQPNPIIYMGNNRSVCDHDTLHLTASVSPQWYNGYIYNWSPGTYLDNTTSSTVVFTAGDTSKIIVTVTTPAGCIAVDSTEIIVHTDSFVHYDTMFTVCPGDSVQLMPMSDDPGTTYFWQPSMYMNNVNSSAPWVFPLTTQSYWAVATSSYGCLDTVNANITVLPAAVMYIPDSITLFAGQSYQIDPQTNCNTFAWFPPAGLNDAYISNPLATPVLSTKYVVTASTEWGCTLTDSISIYVDLGSQLALPNAFAPGNGPDNILRIIVNGEVSLNYFRIYNRWGNLVFSTNDIAAGWDGTFNGVAQPFDVYVYEIEAVVGGGTIVHKHGNITLIR